MSLDEWYQIWMDTCKKNRRTSTKETYGRHYRRIQKALGWRKLTSLNLIIMQQAINDLKSDNERIQEKQPDFERFSPHCFRHTFATRAIENGMPPKSLQKILDHGSLQLTMDLYCHVTEDTLFEAMKLMEKCV